jgi:acetyl esterase
MAPPTAPERLDALTARAALALPAAVKRRLAGRPVRRDGLELDLDTQLLLRLHALSRRPALASLTPARARAEARRAARVAGGRGAPVARVDELRVAGAGGPLAARLYVPSEPAYGAPLVFFHGGGWVVGDLDTHDASCRALCARAGVRVLSVAYRLAPEHPFPIPVDDARRAFGGAVARASELGADAARMAVGGDSAGAHLAAVTAQRAAREGGAAPAFQLLVYPVTDCAEVHSSRRAFAEGFYLTNADMNWYEGHFLAAGGDRRDPRVSPLRAEAEDLAGVAPALVVTAGFDILRDEGEAYAARLRAAGVPTLLRRHPGYIHGFFNAVGLEDGARVALAEMAGALRAALISPPAPRPGGRASSAHPR